MTEKNTSCQRIQPFSHKPLWLYFRFDPYPGPGLVTRIEAGWPPGNPLANQAVPTPVFVATPAEKSLIMNYVRRNDIREKIFDELGLRTMRDMDVDLFRLLIDSLRTQGALPTLNPTQFYATIVQCVRENWEFNNEFTWVILLSFDVEDGLAKVGNVDWVRWALSDLRMIWGLGCSSMGQTGRRIELFFCNLGLIMPTGYGRIS